MEKFLGGIYSSSRDEQEKELQSWTNELEKVAQEEERRLEAFEKKRMGGEDAQSLGQDLSADPKFVPQVAGRRMNAKLLLRERRRQGGRQTQCIGLLSGDNLMLEFSLTGTEDCTSLEKGVSNVRSQGASWKATVATCLGSHDDVKMLCGTIMRDSEAFKETDYAKTNDQQWNRIVLDSFDVHTVLLQCSSFFWTVFFSCISVGCNSGPPGQA